MRRIYSGLVARHNGSLYRVKNTKLGLKLYMDNLEIMEKEIKEIFSVSYNAIFHGVEVFIDEIGDNKLKISFETSLEMKKFHYEEFERGFGRMIVDFDECEEVFLKKTKFRDYDIKGENKEIFQSYSKLEQSVIFE